MRKALQGFTGGFKIGGRTISNLRYADDIVLLATSQEELQDLLGRVERAAKEYSMVINAAMTKVMTNTGEELVICANWNKWTPSCTWEVELGVMPAAQPR